MDQQKHHHHQQILNMLLHLYMRLPIHLRFLLVLVIHTKEVPQHHLHHHNIQLHHHQQRLMFLQILVHLLH